MRRLGLGIVTALIILCAWGNVATAQNQPAMDPEAMIARIVSIDDAQRDTIKDVTFEAEYFEGEYNDDGLFEEKMRFIKKIYLKFNPDTTLMHEEYLECYEKGERLSDEKCDKEAADRIEKKEKRKAKDISYSMLTPFHEEQRGDYNIEYVGVAEKKIDGYVCHQFRVTSKVEEAQHVNGDFYFDAESLRLVRADFSPAKLVKKTMFKMKELNLSAKYGPADDGLWMPRQFDVQGKGKAMFFIGVKFAGTEYYRNPKINSGLADKMFEVNDGK